MKSKIWVILGAIAAWAGCHSQRSPQSQMPDNRIFTVTAEVVGFRQHDLSKMKGRVLMYSYIDLQVESAINKSDPQITFLADTISITRPAVKGDENLKVGMVLQAEIGVDKLEDPQQFYWMRRIE
jgi:hypothetical protein